MNSIGKYRIIKKIGVGGIGVVYRAYDPLIEREVAIKVLEDRALKNPDIKERFYREARYAGKLSHPNITIVHDFGELSGTPYLIMEYLVGTDLEMIIKKRANLTILQKLHISLQICRGLEYSHKEGIVHRDIKPANVKVLKSGIVKIMDFGIAKIGASSLTIANNIIGCPFYMSPEQIKGESVDHRTDIFSFGIMLYELVTHESPFPGDNQNTVMYKIVNEQPSPFKFSHLENLEKLRHVIDKCLQKNTSHRFRNFSEVIVELRRVVKELRIEPEKLKTKSSNSYNRDSGNLNSKVPPTRIGDFYFETNSAKTNSIKNEEQLSQNEALDNELGLGATIENQKSRRTFRKTYFTLLALVILSSLLIFNFTNSGTRVGYVFLNVAPWAMITKVVNEKGRDLISITNKNSEYTTPCNLTLPEGTYQVHLKHPNFAELTMIIEVKKDTLQEFYTTLAHFNQNEILKSL